MPVKSETRTVTLIDGRATYGCAGQFFCFGGGGERAGANQSFGMHWPKPWMQAEHIVERLEQIFGQLVVRRGRLPRFFFGSERHENLLR